MITVTCYDCGFTIKGHSGYAPIGQDIVCAAVSTLVQTFLVSVEEFTHDEIKSDMAAGNAVIEYGNLSKDAQLLLDSFFLGLKHIAEIYPAFVRVI